MREMQSRFVKYLTPLLVTSLMAGIVLAVIAPLNTQHMSLAMRLIFWVGLCLAGGLGAAAAEGVLKLYRRRSGARDFGPWGVAAWQSIGATLAVSLFLIAPRLPMLPKYMALNLFYIWVIAIVISSVGALQKSGTMSEPRDDSEAGLNSRQAPLYRRLKPALRQCEIYALRSEDHYVRVITSGGDDLILMRLSDAITEVEPVVGLSPHRSWWVAEQGVKTVARKDGKTQITLNNGAVVSVSRSGAKGVKAAGWL